MAVPQKQLFLTGFQEYEPNHLTLQVERDALVTAADRQLLMRLMRLFLIGGVLLLVYFLVAAALEHIEQVSSAGSEVGSQSSVPLGAASKLAATHIGRGEKFEQVAIQGGTGVLVDEHWAFWVKDGQMFALNGLAKGIAPDLPYGPPGLGSDDLRRALHPTPNPTPTAPLAIASEHQNPLGNSVHYVLRSRGFLASEGDAQRSTCVWKNDASGEIVTGQFEGSGNGMFNRRILTLQLKRSGTLAWQAEGIKVDEGRLFVDTGAGWQEAAIAAAVKATTPPVSRTETRPPSGDQTALGESQRRKIYYELCAAQDAGVDDTLAYYVMAKRFSVPVDTVRAIAVEGAIKKWPLPPLP